MKKAIRTLILYSLLVSCYHVFSASNSPSHTTMLEEPSTALKAAAFEVLNAKCNVCHRKQNPFKVFSLKNMEKHAPKIYKQVFVYRRMPKGDRIKLTEEEYETLKKWLKSRNIF